MRGGGDSQRKAAVCGTGETHQQDATTRRRRRGRVGLRVVLNAPLVVHDRDAELCHKEVDTNRYLEHLHIRHEVVPIFCSDLEDEGMEDAQNVEPVDLVVGDAHLERGKQALAEATPSRPKEDNLARLLYRRWKVAERRANHDASANGNVERRHLSRRKSERGGGRDPGQAQSCAYIRAVVADVRLWARGRGQHVAAEITFRA